MLPHDGKPAVRIGDGDLDDGMVEVVVFAFRKLYVQPLPGVSLSHWCLYLANLFFFPFSLHFSMIASLCCRKNEGRTDSSCVDCKVTILMEGGI